MKAHTSILTLFYRLSNHLIFGAVYLLVITVPIWFMLRLVIGDQWGMVRMGSYFAPWLYIGLMVGALLAIGSRRRWLSWYIILLLVGGGLYYGPLFVPNLPQAKAQPESLSTLRVMTFNVHYSNRNVAQIAEMIRAEQPDIIALQEITPPLTEPLLAELAAEYPYVAIDEVRHSSLGVMSRYPISNQPKPLDVIRAQYATVTTPDGAIAVWNLHPIPAVGRERWLAQRKTMAGISRAIGVEKGPIIVLGDFNATPEAENFQLIAQQLTNVHRAAGYGFAFTFPDTGPESPISRFASPFRVLPRLVGIDHILVSRHFAPLNSYVLPGGGGSDHRPVMAVVQWAE